MPVPALHLTLGKLIQREYDPLFFTSPISTPVADLGFQIVETVWGTDLGGDPVVYGLILEDAAKGIYVVGCGTRTEVEWVMDAEALLDQVPWAPAGVKAHRGFLRLNLTLRTSKDVLLSAFLAGSRPIVTGHSLWGAQAVLLAAQVQAKELVAFAPPRVWNPAGADWADGRVPVRTLYMNAHPIPDVVPLVPPEWPEPFRHQERSAIRMTAAQAAPTFSDRHSIPTYLAEMEAIP